MRNQVALGIDISDRQISMALLKREKNGLKVLKAGSAPVPEGTIKDGCIEKPEVLTKTINDLKSHNKMRTKKAAISLSTGSSIVRILDAPKGAPSNIRQFVQNEFKSYVALSGRKIAFDYCGINSGHGLPDRLLTVAADSEELALLTKTCRRAHLDVEAVEPPILGYIRALFAERIEGRYDNDVLLAVLKSGVLTLCVFRKQTLDFVRIEDISGNEAEPDELCRWLANELNAVIQFYNIEVADSAGKWEITVVADGVQLPEAAQTSLKAMIESADLEIRTGENACQDTIVDKNGHEEQLSALAIGLAMGLLNARQIGLRINLVPPESAEVRAVKKQFVLTTAVIVMVIPLLMIAVGTVFSRMAAKIKRSTVDRNQTELLEDTHTNFTELQLLNQQIDLISNRPDELNKILGTRPDLDWAKILEDIRVNTPGDVRITELSASNKGQILLKGQALTYQDARDFEDNLNKLVYFDSASLYETKKEGDAEAFVLYEIDCLLKMDKGNT